MIREFRRMFVGSVALALLVVACGTEGGEGAESQSGSGDEDTLAGFFGWGTEDPEASEAKWREDEARLQEAIRGCMAADGFEYLPMIQPEESYQVFTPEDEEERVRTQGFGITTWYGNEDQDQGAEWFDPNEEVVNAMSDTERDAWYAALYGTEEEQMEGATVEVDPETGEEMTMYEGYGAGCQGEAAEEVYGDMEASNGLWEELQPQMEAMSERMQADPRIVDMQANWSTCMAEAGFDYESRDNMHETIWDDFQVRFEEIVGSSGGYADPFADWSQEEIDAFFAEKTEDEINAFFEQAESESQADIDQEAVAALQQEEIDLATADFECGKDEMEIWEEVSQDFESDFIAENREQLEAIRAAEQG